LYFFRFCVCECCYCARVELSAARGGGSGGVALALALALGGNSWGDYPVKYRDDRPRGVVQGVRFVAGL
jgi:hypothetical protein